MAFFSVVTILTKADLSPKDSHPIGTVQPLLRDPKVGKRPGDLQGPRFDISFLNWSEKACYPLMISFSNFGGIPYDDLFDKNDTYMTTYIGFGVPHPPRVDILLMAKQHVDWKPACTPIPSHLPSMQLLTWLI